jgi:ABC-type microcin C transport system duplicated ATPase subunit YejF
MRLDIAPYTYTLADWRKGYQSQWWAKAESEFTPWLYHRSPFSFSIQVNIARALYYDPDIVLFDDPLSAGEFTVYLMSAH